jgi:hypothetical protein
MQNYLECTNGWVHLAKILDAVGKRQTNLPTLPKYVHPTGRPFLCWSSILGRCTYRDCYFCKEGGHPIPVDVTDEFVDQCINIIGKGVIAHSGHLGGCLPETSKGARAATRPDDTAPWIRATRNGVQQSNACKTLIKEGNKLLFYYQVGTLNNESLLLSCYWCPRYACNPSR